MRSFLELGMAIGILCLLGLVATVLWATGHGIETWGKHDGDEE